MDVIGTTQTPSGRLYAYLVMPHTTHRTDGGLPSFVKNPPHPFQVLRRSVYLPRPEPDLECTPSAVLSLDHCIDLPPTTVTVV